MGDEGEERRLMQWLEHRKTLSEISLGSYGGGDAQKMSQTIYFSLLNNEPHFEAELKEKIKKEALKYLNTYKQVKNQNRIAQLNENFTGENINWEEYILIANQIPDEKEYNIMLQGWLFDEEIMKGRIGPLTYPLIGLFSPSSGVIQHNNEIEMNGNVDPMIGIECLRPADQHTHWVEDIMDFDGYLTDLSDWHFGSDMAKFLINEDQKLIHSWVGAVDTFNNKGLLAKLIIVQKDEVVHLSNFNSFSNATELLHQINQIVKDV